MLSFQNALLFSLAVIVLGQCACVFKSSLDQNGAANDSDIPLRLRKNMHQSSSPIDILYGGQGSHPGFLKELKASIKSVLINAPLDAQLRIHFLVDQEAQEAITTNILEKHALSEWKSRQPISIHTYNVESLVPRWMGVIDTTYSHFPKEMNWYRHTTGAYFRLFADEVLPADVGNFLYMDSDVIVMSNLNKLWQQVSHRNSYFQWGEELCSGFLIINKSKLKDFWKRIQNYDLLQLRGYTVSQAQKKVRQKGLGDQFLLRAMNATEPLMIETLPVEWDVSANDGPWWKRNGTGLEVDRQSGVGMLHFNGGGSSKESAFQSHLFLADKDNEFPNTWGLAHYYDRLPWFWAKYMVESQISNEPSQISIEHHIGAGST